MKRFIHTALLVLLLISFSACDDDFNNTDSSESDTAVSRTTTIPPPTPNEISMQNGQELFKKNCAMCHSIGGSDIVGPGMEGVIKRVPNPYDKWLLKYIKNNVAVLKSGDAYANKLYENNNHASMTVFDTILTDNEIKDIINYIAKAHESVPQY